MDEAGERAGELDALPTEAWAAELADLDLRTVAEQLAMANALDAQVPGLVAAAADQVARVVQAAVQRLDRGGRLRYVGAGTRRAGRGAGRRGGRGHLRRARGPGARRRGRRPRTASRQQAAEDDESAGGADVAALGLTAADVLVAVSASGRTPYVLAAAEQGRRDGALTVGLVCATGSPLAAGCDLGDRGADRPRAGRRVHPAAGRHGPEARAQPGVDADDGRARPHLREPDGRGAGGQRQAGPPPGPAARAGHGCRARRRRGRAGRRDGDGKTAAVMLLAGVDAEQARHRLAVARGYVRAAVETPAQA